MMEQNKREEPTPITMVISEVAKLDRLREYEEWANDLIRAVKTFEGFAGVDVIRPGDHSHPEYVLIIIFDGFDHLKSWQESQIFAELMAHSEELIVGEAQIQKASGLELWFTLPDESRFMPRPAYYKMVIVSMIGVFSIVLLVNAVFGPLLDTLPYLLSLLISVTAVSALMTYPVMPYLTHWLNPWLYPTQKKVSAGQG
jgi:antibiotic biosynthesis monooxygenase (ABM) superfamily enzyme